MRGYLPVHAEVHGRHVRCLKRDVNAEDDDAGLGWFDFESENPVAVSTGTLLWDASLFIIQLLNDHTPVHAGKSLADMMKDSRVLELGSGIGLAGLCCAAAGANICLSDLPSIVDGIMETNIQLNTTRDLKKQTQPGNKNDTSMSHECSASDGQENEGATETAGTTHAVQQLSDDSNREAGLTSSCIAAQETTLNGCHQKRRRAWHGAKPCGPGTVTSIPVDFCKPLHEQVKNGCDPRDAEVVLAADIIWLKELVHPLAQTIGTILRHSSDHSDNIAGQHECHQPAPTGENGIREGEIKVALLAFGERAKSDSKLFISLEEVCSAFEQQGLQAAVAVRRVMERDGDKLPVVLVCITA